MRTSILIAAYNAEKFLAETIESVQAQTNADWELVVVDDGSRDGTAQVVQEYARRDPRIRLVCQPNGGAVVARNRGMREANPASEFVVLLDHDDAWTPDALETLIQTLEANPEAVGAHGLVRYTDENLRSLWDYCPIAAYRRHQAFGSRLVPVPPECPTTFAMMVAWCCIPTPGVVLIRHETLRQVGLFDERNPHLLDWDLWLQLTRLGDLAFTPKVLLHYRQHAASATNNTKWLHDAICEARRRLWNAPENSPGQTRLIRRSYRPTQRYLFAEKMGYIREHLRRGDLRTVLRQSLYALRHAARYLRGRP